MTCKLAAESVCDLLSSQAEPQGTIAMAESAAEGCRR